MTRDEFEALFMSLKKEANPDHYNEALGKVWFHDLEQREEIDLLRVQLAGCLTKERVP